MSSHHNPAPQCAPYERKVLSLTGEHPAGTHRIDGQTVTVKDTLTGARSHGLHHPSCRHTVTAYLPGFTDTTAPVEDPGHEGDKATQKQRRLEREIRRSRRMEQAAITPESKAKATARRKNYEAKLRQHIKDHDLPRRRHREQLRGPTPGTRKPPRPPPKHRHPSHTWLPGAAGTEATGSPATIVPTSLQTDADSPGSRIVSTSTDRTRI